MPQAPAKPPDLTQMFVHNMRELWRLDPPLALALDRVEDAELPALEETRSGCLTLSRRTQDGRSIYLHSRYDPVAEARKWVKHNVEEDKFCYIVEGAGLGYHVQVLFEILKGDIIVVVLEPDLAVLRLALSVLDLAAHIRSRRLAFLTEANKHRVHQQLSCYSSFILMGTKIVTHQPSAQLSRAGLRDIRQMCMAYIDYAKTGLVTLVTNAQTTCRNIANNLPTYVATPPINPLKSRFRGYPAVVVSAGPSLRRNVDHLAEARGKAVIIATQTTFKPLLDRGITPDFVCSLDYHELSRHYYEGVADFRDVHLIAEPKAHHSVIDTFGGRVSLLSNDFAARCLGASQGVRDGLRAGASVAHLAFYLAEYLGCDPVILIGQDLALTDHVYYAPGVAIHELWQPEMNRFCTIEMKEWERIVRSRPILRTVRDQQGREIYTEELMFNYLEQFEKDFANTHVRVIDATEGGARKQGAEVMTLQEAIAQCCRQPIDAQCFDYRSRPWFDHAALRRGQAEIEARLSELGEIESLCDRTLEVLEELQGLVDRPEVFNRRIRKVDELRLQVKARDRAYGIIVAGSQMAEFRKFSADQRLKASGAVGAERARKQLERDVAFVGALRADTSRMVAILQASASRFQAKIAQLEEAQDRS